MSKSIITDNLSLCMICGRPSEAIHHLISGNGRSLATADGLVVGLCRECHNMFENSREDGEFSENKILGYSCDFHHCRKLELTGKIIGQLAWEKNYYRQLCSNKAKSSDIDTDCAREFFLRRYGKKYI